MWDVDVEAEVEAEADADAVLLHAALPPKVVPVGLALALDLALALQGWLRLWAIGSVIEVGGRCEGQPREVTQKGQRVMTATAAVWGLETHGTSGRRA